VIKPPADITPAKLFRLLCRVPRPVVPIVARFAFMPEQALHCRAMHPLEWAEWEDAGDDLETVVLQHALCDEMGQPLLDRESVFLLTDSERETVFAELVSALNKIGPGYQRPEAFRCDVDAWHTALEKGAAANVSILLSLGTAYEGAADRYTATPERYFGIDRRELLDGHWMAYRAARDVIEKHQKRRR